VTLDQKRRWIVLGSFIGGFLGGAAAGAQITGPLLGEVAANPWGLAIVAGFAVVGGIAASFIAIGQMAPTEGGPDTGASGTSPDGGTGDSSSDTGTSSDTGASSDTGTSSSSEGDVEQDKQKTKKTPSED